MFRTLPIDSESDRNVTPNEGSFNHTQAVDLAGPFEYLFTRNPPLEIEDPLALFEFLLGSLDTEQIVTLQLFLQSMVSQHPPDLIENQSDLLLNPADSTANQLDGIEVDHNNEGSQNQQPSRPNRTRSCKLPVSYQDPNSDDSFSDCPEVDSIQRKRKPKQSGKGNFSTDQQAGIQSNAQQTTPSAQRRFKKKSKATHSSIENDKLYDAAWIGQVLAYNDLLSLIRIFTTAIEKDLINRFMRYTETIFSADFSPRFCKEDFLSVLGLSEVLVDSESYETAIKTYKAKIFLAKEEIKRPRTKIKETHMLLKEACGEFLDYALTWRYFQSECTISAILADLQSPPLVKFFLRFFLFYQPYDAAKMELINQLFLFHKNSQSFVLNKYDRNKVIGFLRIIHAIRRGNAKENHLDATLAYVIKNFETNLKIADDQNLENINALFLLIVKKLDRNDLLLLKIQPYWDPEFANPDPVSNPPSNKDQEVDHLLQKKLLEIKKNLEKSIFKLLVSVIDQCDQHFTYLEKLYEVIHQISKKEFEKELNIELFEQQIKEIFSDEVNLDFDSYPTDPESSTQKANFALCLKRLRNQKDSIKSLQAFSLGLMASMQAPENIMRSSLTCAPG